MPTSQGCEGGTIAGGAARGCSGAARDRVLYQAQPHDLAHRRPVGAGPQPAAAAGDPRVQGLHGDPVQFGMSVFVINPRVSTFI